MNDKKCRGCQREDLHKACPAHRTPFYMSGVPYTPKIELACKIARRIHKDQKRWSGADYFTDHICGVVNIAVELIQHDKNFTEPDIEHLCSLSYLHDTQEDCKDEDRQFLDEQILENFKDLQSDLNVLTRIKDIPYCDYIKNIIKNGSNLCLIVKMSDLSHNSSNIPDNERLKDRYSKYILAGCLIMSELQKRQM